MPLEATAADNDATGLIDIPRPDTVGGSIEVSPVGAGSAMGLNALDWRGTTEEPSTGDREGLRLAPRLGDFERERKYILAGLGLVLRPRSGAGGSELLSHSADGSI